jgi:hypothetical protein
MGELDSTTRSHETTTDEDWDRRPAITLLSVIVTWYIGTIGIVLTQAF